MFHVEHALKVCLSNAFLGSTVFRSMPKSNITPLYVLVPYIKNANASQLA